MSPVDAHSHHSITPIYAHSLDGGPEDEWELLGEHLRRVADGAASFLPPDQAFDVSA